MEDEMKKCVLVLSLLMALIGPVYADVATFEDLNLAAGSYWNGSGGSGGFTSADAYFLNGYDSTWGSWDGWAYSNMTDTTTAGYSNQFSAITGSGVNGSATYGVAYDGGAWGMASPPGLSFGAVSGTDYNTVISGAYFTNTTYAYLSMRDGDAFAKKFGGLTGDDPDYFKLTIKGITEEAEYTSPVEFFLADFRFEDNRRDYIVDQWTWVDLSGLGPVVGLEFSMESSDVGDWGINTPTYFAMDNLNAVPVPGTLSLLLCGLLALAGTGRRAKDLG